MKRLHADFERTFKALEEGLQVEHVAEFELKTCHPEDPVSDYLDEPSLAAYDQFPVRTERGIVGVLERTRRGNVAHGSSQVADAMTALNSSMIVSNSQPVASLLNAFHTAPYRLVVKGSDIEGIVTASDLLKLPVRLYAFMLVTHLEMLMAATIRKRFRDQPAGSWMAMLSTGRQGKVSEKIEAFSRRKLDPDPVELTDFCDKREILRQFHNSAGRFVNEMKEIEELRNSLAHAANYLSSQDDLQTFLRRIQLVRRNIAYLQGRLGRHEF